MASNIYSLYRFCFKQLYSLHKIDPIIYQHFCSTIKKIKYRKEFKTQQNIVEFLQAFGNFLQKVNSGENKSCLKLIRIYSNSSQFCDSQLNINTSFESKALQNLGSDLQYLDLNEKDQQFVQKVIKKVCESKKKLKYKNICVFLNNHNSQNFEKKITLDMLDPQIIHHFRKGRTNLGAYFQEMVLEEEDKMHKVLQQMYLKGIVVF